MVKDMKLICKKYLGFVLKSKEFIAKWALMKEYYRGGEVKDKGIELSMGTLLS